MSSKKEHKTIDGIECRQCSCCGKWLPCTDEYFNRSSYSSDGLRSTCKSCRYANENEENSKRMKKWYQVNIDKAREARRNLYYKSQEEYKAKSKEYYEQHKSKVLKREQKYKAQNKKEILIKAREYRQQHEEQVKDAQKKCYEQNKEHYQQYKKQYRKTQHGKEMIAVANKRRKANKRELVSTFTQNDWIKCKAIFQNCCAYCGTKFDRLQQEHFIPVNAGGTYTKDNIVPSCRRCNLSKHDNDFAEWYPKQKFYSKDREKFIIDYLSSMKVE